MKIKPIAIVGTDINGQLVISGDLSNKKMLLNALAEGIKLVANYEKKIVEASNLRVLGN